MKRPYRRMLCREPACRKKLEREEVLYNAGYCDSCVESFIARGEAEKKRLAQPIVHNNTYLDR